MLRLMSGPQENRKGTLLEWVKDSGLLTITILGLLVYTLFAIPTAIFYYTLGASLAEVGVTYTSLLSGSVLGLMVIVLALGYSVVFLYFYYSLRVAYRTVRSARKEVSTTENPYPHRKDWQLEDEDFEARVDWLKTQYANYPVVGNSLKLGWGEFESKLRRRRELRRMENLTLKELSELQSIEHQIARYRSRAYGNVIGGWVKRHPILLGIAYLVTVAVISLFAFISATDVQNGRSAGSVSDVFGYRAKLVTVCPASAADEKMYEWLIGEKTYLLGETAQNAVLYLPHTDLPHAAETIQVPIAAVMISSSTSSTGHCRG
jgi:amino acid transporter